MQKFCPNYSVVAWVSKGRQQGMFTRLRCGQWSCEFCAKINAGKWREFLLTKLPLVSDNWHLLTLTAHARLRSKTGSFENIRGNIDRFMKRMHRTFGAFDYVRTFEKHPTSSAIHAHFIVSRLTPFVVHGHHKNHVRGFIGVTERPYWIGCWTVNSFVKATAQDCQMGYIADCKPINGSVDRAIWYVTKYLTKDLQNIGIKGLRHVQTSRRIGSPQDKSNLAWAVGPYVTRASFQPGQSFIDLQTGEVVAPDWWDTHQTYPPYRK